MPRLYNKSDRLERILYTKVAKECPYKNLIMFKKILFAFAIFLLGVFLSAWQVQAADSATLHLFWSRGCPHCAKEKAYLEEIADQYPDLIVEEYEVSEKQNSQLLGKVGKALQAEVSGVPFTVIGDDYLTGYLNDETTGQKIEEMIETALKENSPDIVNKIKSETGYSSTPDSPQDSNSNAVQIDLPLVGSITNKTFSLPVLTLIIALLDGFNPCAMWVLVFLISLLLNLKDKKRRWILGGSFIAASALVYFLFLTAWLNFFLVVGFIPIIRLFIGLFAVGVGLYQLYDSWKNKYGACKVVEPTKRKVWFEKMKSIVDEKKLFLAVAGMVILAVAVNMVELVCSAGLPAIYTQVLALSNLAAWQYYGLLLLYILIFMIDDLFIFVVAMTTLQTTGIESKYARYSHIVGGTLILILGILLVLKPEWLMFG